MIRVFTDGFVPKMDLVELQGNIQLPDSAGAEKHPSSYSPPPSTTEARPDDKNDDAVPEVVLGYVERDHLNPKQRTLRIGTLQVTGSYHTFKHPMLVLRARHAYTTTDSADAQCEEDDEEDEHSRSTASPVTPPPSAEPVLLETWLDAHPHATSLNYLFRKETHEKPGTDNSRKRAREGDEVQKGTNATTTTSAAAAPSVAEDESEEMKDYQLVGWIDDKTVFNSKPARVFA